MIKRKYLLKCDYCGNQRSLIGGTLRIWYKYYKNKGWIIKPAMHHHFCSISCRDAFYQEKADLTEAAFLDRNKLR